jgi:hypothetical protein
VEHLSMQSLQVRSLQFSVSAQEAEHTGGCVAIPRHELVTLHSELRDWRRVKITWNAHVYVVSRTAWDNAMPVTSADETRAASSRAKRPWLQF